MKSKEDNDKKILNKIPIMVIGVITITFFLLFIMQNKINDEFDKKLEDADETYKETENEESSNQVRGESNNIIINYQYVD